MAYMNVTSPKPKLNSKQILYQDSFINVIKKKIITRIQNINITVIKISLNLVCEI